MRIGILALTTAVLLLAAPGTTLAAPSITQSRTLKTFTRIFATKHTKNNLGKRRGALKRTRKIQSADAIRALVKAYVALDAEALPIRRERGVVLDTRTSLELVRFRKKLDPIDELQDEILRQIEAMPESLADTMLEELSMHSRLVDQVFSLQIALARKTVGFTKVDLLRQSLLRPLEIGARIAYVRVIDPLGPRGKVFAKWLIRQLDEDSRTLRLEAARTLGNTGARSAVPALVARMATERGRVKETIAAALHRLTGQNHGMSAEAWKKWLDSLEKPDDIPAPTSGTFATPPVAPKMGEYFSIAQEGRSILYVFDRSDSMERDLESDGTRIQKSRRELNKALKALTPEVRFNIVAFSIKVRPWEKSLIEATPANVKKARRWVYDLDLQAGTSSYDALERSFRIAGCRSIDRFDELDVETMFFLSDGEPTRRTGGTIKPLVRDNVDRILGAVRRFNPLGRVKLHSIGLALETKNAPRFMSELAKQHGGTFAAIR